MGYLIMFMFGMLAGMLIGAWAHHMDLKRQARKRAGGITPPAGDKEPCYGHPRPPVSTLRKMLPTPAPGHVWETAIRTDDQGVLWLDLALMQLMTETKAGEYHIDLTNRHSEYGGYIYGTWADKYRDWDGVLATERPKILRHEVLGPAVDWATQLVNKVTSAGTVRDYKLGD